MKMLSVYSLSRRVTRFLLGLLGVFLLGATLVHAEPYLVVSGDLRGEIKPCGCAEEGDMGGLCLLYTSPSPRDRTRSRMPSSA